MLPFPEISLHSQFHSSGINDLDGGVASMDGANDSDVTPTPQADGCQQQNISQDNQGNNSHLLY